jgi:histidinol dehydrogenase
MRIVRLDNGFSRAALPADVEESVREILAAVARGGDAAVLDFTERFDHAELGPEQLRVDSHELESSIGVLEPAVLTGLRTAIDNVRAVARAQLREPAAVELPEGHRVEITEVPVRRAAIYVPGGEAPYPSTVVMGAVTARAAGVDEIVVCAPPGPRGRAHPVILAACVLCEVQEVYRMGGAQAIGALAYGTESVRRVDVIVGPGNPYVQGSTWVSTASRGRASSRWWRPARASTQSRSPSTCSRNRSTGRTARYGCSARMSSCSTL